MPPRDAFRLLFAHNPLPMCVFDEDTLEFVEVNNAAIEHYGCSRGEFLSMRITDIHPAEDLDALRAYLATDRPKLRHAGVWRHRRRDGSIIDVEIHSHVLELAGRQRVLVVMHDLSEQRRLEHQLQQAQKMEAIGQLAGGIAHDFNNLLTAILGYCQLLLQDMPSGDPRRADVEEIRKAGESAASLTTGLLAFSRQQMIEPVALDLNATVSDTARLLKRVVGEDVHVTLRLQPGLHRVRADPTQVGQVLMNLAANARDAMPTGGRLLIETANVELDEHYAGTHLAVVPGPYVMLAVADTGVGMTEEVRQHLFEPFFTTKERGKGTGLGLASIYGIVKQNGGNIWVYSEPGHGTTFKVYWPKAPDGAVVKEGPDTASQPLAGTATILLVEDRDNLIALARRVLERHGYTVLVAQSGEQALQLSSQHAGPIHLLLTDVVMPDISGPRLAEQLRARRPELKVLFMSGFTDHSVVRSGLVDAGRAFLQKPFTPEQLARKVVETIGGPLR